MKRNRGSVALGIVLSALAGFVDAAGFLHLGGPFVSFMSGNSTRLGVSLSRGEWPAVLVGAALIALFVGGAMLGALIARATPAAGQRVAVIGAETFLLLGAAALHERGTDAAAIAVTVLAMGCENAVFARDGTVAVGLTYMTGALVKMGHGLVAALFGGGRLSEWGPEALLWSGLVAGAATGAWCYARIGLGALWIAGGVAALCTAWAALDRRGLGAAA